MKVFKFGLVVLAVVGVALAAGRYSSDYGAEKVKQAESCTMCSGTGCGGDCVQCDGIGITTKDCYVCNGKGWTGKDTKCYSCKGAGVKNEKCMFCKGTGCGRKCLTCKGTGIVYK